MGRRKFHVNCKTGVNTENQIGRIRRVPHFQLILGLIKLAEHNNQKILSISCFQIRTLLISIFSVGLFMTNEPFVIKELTLR